MAPGPAFAENVGRAGITDVAFGLCRGRLPSDAHRSPAAVKPTI